MAAPLLAVFLVPACTSRIGTSVTPAATCSPSAARDYRDSVSHYCCPRSPAEGAKGGLSQFTGRTIYNYLPPPAITGITPSTGRPGGGTTVTIT